VLTNYLIDDAEWINAAKKSCDGVFLLFNLIYAVTMDDED
jgi:hypothetical protein